MKTLHILITIAVLAIAMPDANAFWPFTRNKEKKENSSTESKRSDQNGIIVENSVEGEKTPVPEVTVPGSSNVVNVNIGKPEQPYKRQTNVEAESKGNIAEQSEEESWYKKKFPMWMALIGTGVGIFIVFAAIKYGRKSSPAVDQAWGYMDEKLAEWIRQARERSMSSADPVEMARFNAEIAELEAERGRVAGKKRK